MSSLATKLFGLLEGKWEIVRVVATVGKLKGTAQFVKQKNTAPGNDELLYSETGVFEFFNNSNTFNASRRYFYRLVSDDQGKKDIAVYFDDGNAVAQAPPDSNYNNNNSESGDLNNNDNTNTSQSGRLFHKFGLAYNQPSSDGTRLKLSAVHFCANDIYNVNYDFKLEVEGSDGTAITTSLNEFNIIYDVEGPNKSYVSETSFKRSN
jgi:hypothetical protein